MAAAVKTLSSGRRLTRPAPLRMAELARLEMPLPTLWTLPASLMASGSLNLRGGAKSNEVNVVDLRSRCLRGFHVRFTTANPKERRGEGGRRH